MPAPLALLLVHGIGRQARGDTLTAFLGGMRLACGERLTIVRDEPGRAVLWGFGRTVHAYEVFWADLLSGPAVAGTFERRRLSEWAWFPRLYALENPAATRPARWQALADSFGLSASAALVSAGLFGLGPLFAFAHGLTDAARESVRRPLKAGRARSALDVALDEVAGDVFNYVHAAANAFPPPDEERDGPHPDVALIAARVAEIRVRFVAAVRRAQQDGCHDVQVLAHSLGTVIAFRSLSRAAADGAVAIDPAALRLTHLHTFGSPIEKVRRFWWRVLDGCENGPGLIDGGTLLVAAAPNLRWDNYFSRFDLVSGPIGAWGPWPAPQNHPAAGLGGLVGAHVAYHGNPSFVSGIAAAITGVPATVVVPWPRMVAQRARAVAETLAAPTVAAAVALFGFVWMVGFAWLVGRVVSWPVRWVGLPTLAAIVEYYIPISIFFLMTVGDMIVGRNGAARLHRQFWARCHDRRRADS